MLKVFNHFLWSLLVAFVCLGFQPVLGAIELNRIVRDIHYVGVSPTVLKLIPPSSNLRVKVGARLRQQDLSRDLNQLYLTGYFKSVKAQTITTRNQFVLQFYFDENPVVSEIWVEGNSVFSDNRIRRRMSQKSKRILNLNALDEDYQSLTSMYEAKGYSFVDVAQLKLDQEDRLNIEIMESKVGNVHVHGLDRIPEFVAKRGLYSQPGRVFNRFELSQDRVRLVRLGYFSDVKTPVITPTQNGQLIDIDFDIKERKTNLLDLGLEQEDRSIVFFTKSDVHHVLIPSDLISAKFQLGLDNDQADARSYSAKYYQPWFLNKWPMSFSTTVWTNFRKEFLTQDRDRREIFDTRRQGWDTVLGFPFLVDKLNLSAKYKSEKVSPRDVDDNNFSDYAIRSFTGTLSYRTIKDIFNPKQGGYFTIEYEKGGNWWFTDVGGLNFMRVSTNYAYFKSITKRSVLGFRAFAGVFKPNEDNVSTFEAEGYELGGATSLRGYEESDFVGFRELLFNLEYRFDFTKSFQGVLFYDIGRTFDSGLDIASSEYNVGRGFGFRYFTAVGPVRVDLAWGKDWLIQFGLGQMF